uniref:Uncharacterized protein n=1 Tax=Arundo donax TaxID=35708 RepID=A0A0A9ANR7_ARUDO
MRFVGQHSLQCTSCTYSCLEHPSNWGLDDTAVWRPRVTMHTRYGKNWRNLQWPLWWEEANAASV